MNRGMHWALVRQATGRVVCDTIPTPQPAGGEVLVAVRQAGICGTDLQILQGLRPDPAAILGHEGVAEVVAIGPGVAPWRVGQKVTFNPTHPLAQTAMLGHTIDGLFQQYLLMSRAAVDRGTIIGLDPSFPERLGVLLEPLAAVVYAHSLVHQVVTPQSVAIFGAGSIGLLHALYFKVIADAHSRLFLIHPHSGRLEWARNRDIIAPEQGYLFLEGPSLPDAIRHQTNGRGVDAAFLCTPRPAALTALRHALQVVRRDGCIDLFGGFTDGDRLSELPSIDLNGTRRANCAGVPVPGRIVRTQTANGKALWLTGHRGVGTAHIHAAMQLLIAHPTWFGRVISHVVSLQGAATLLNQLVTTGRRHVGGGEWVKIIIDCLQESMVIDPVAARPDGWQHP